MPVRITFPEAVLKTVPLRPGLSVVATVHTRDPERAEADAARRARRLEAAPIKQDRQAVSEAAALLASRGAAGRGTGGRRAAGAVVPGTSAPSALAAFIFMVFGMFMAILDIQIVSASLSQIQAGLSASSDEITWVQTSLSRSPKWS